MKVTKIDREESLAKLRQWLPAGTTVYTILTHVSRSGMSRRIKPIFIEDNQPRFIGWHVSRVLGLPLHKDDGVRIGGCGMDMGFAMVYELSQTLHGNGYALKQSWL